MTLKKRIFDEKRINTGRQTEVDFAKAVIIFFLAFIHCIIECTPAENLTSGIPYLFDSVIGGPLAAPMFIFAMGFGMIYTKKDSPKDFAVRGIKLGLISYVLNICRFLIPYLIGYAVTGEHEKYIQPLVYKVLGCDVLQFASISMLIMALVLYLKIPDIILIIGSVLLSFLGTYLNGTDLGNNPLNIIFGYFIGTEDQAGNIISDFPILNWFIVLVSGYIFGKILMYVKNKNMFYILISPLCIAVTTAYFIFGIVNTRGMFGEGQNCYYHIRTDDVLITITAVLGVFGLYHLAAKIMPEAVLKIIGEVSKAINSVYCIHWVIVVIVTNVVIYVIRGTQELSVPVTLILSFAISIVSIAIAYYWRKFKNHKKGAGKNERKVPI